VWGELGLKPCFTLSVCLQSEERRLLPRKYRLAKCQARIDDLEYRLAHASTCEEIMSGQWNLSLALQDKEFLMGKRCSFESRLLPRLTTTDPESAGLPARFLLSQFGLLVLNNRKTVAPRAALRLCGPRWIDPAYVKFCKYFAKFCMYQRPHGRHCKEDAAEPP
jgi:hypothetical protein